MRLAHFEFGAPAPGRPPLVLIHGWTGDHGVFAPQIERFSASRRVVAVNLRGHGASDAPEGAYTIQGFADDIAWQCREAGIIDPVVIGGSFGGVVALELCGRHPDLAAGLVMIDAMVMIRPAVRERPEIGRYLAALGGPNYRDVVTRGAWNLGGTFDDPQRRQSIFEAYIRGPCEKTPQHVAYPSMKNLLLEHDPLPAASRCEVPMAYISADVASVELARDLTRLKEVCPQLVTAKTLLAGHFNTVEVADQVNAMLDRFLAVALAPGRRTGPDTRSDAAGV